jgi:hypothetical protein
LVLTSTVTSLNLQKCIAGCMYKIISIKGFCNQSAFFLV